MFAGLFILLFLAQLLYSQIGEWRNYTDMKNVKQIIVDGNVIVAATDGGVLFFYPNSERYEKLMKVDGLFDVEAKAVALDDRYIFVGFANGIIDMIERSTGNITHILDIYFSDETDRVINALRVYGDTLFIATNFGVSIFKISKLEFGDTYKRIHRGSGRIKVYDVEIKSDTIYLATSEGIAIGYRFAGDLVAPDGWRVYPFSNGFKRIAVVKNRIYAGGSDGVFLLSGQEYSRVFKGDVRSILHSGDSLIIATKYSIFSLKDNLIKLITSNTPDLINDISIWGDKIIAGVRGNGIGIYDTSWSFYYPPGPNSNKFSDLAIDSDGNLWAASARIGGSGFYRFDGESWKNFSSKNYKMNNNCYRVRVGRKYVWVGTWGGGVIRVDGNDSIRVFNRDDGLNGVEENPDYVVITDAVEDGYGNVWILNYRAGDKNIIAVLKPDMSFEFFKNGYDPSYVYNTQLEIDEMGRKWIVAEHQAIIYFDDGGTLEDRSDDIWGAISRGDGLIGKPTTIEFDRTGDLWVGTDAGISVIIQTEDLNSIKVRDIYLLRDYYINDIEVDAMNNKWIATKNGVWVLSPDGTSLLAHYDAENSPLLADDVKSIAIDHRSGVVYFGTDKGLTSLRTTAVEPVENFGFLSFYPNPFYPDRDGEVVIDGLVANSMIKIFTVSGNLVNEFSSPGGRIAIWDGRNMFGELVPTGVYIVVAYSEDGSKIGVGKIAVVRR